MRVFMPATATSEEGARAGPPDRVMSTTVDQFMSMEAGNMDGQTRALVFFRGHLDEVRLLRAVRLTLDAEPMLGYRFVSDARRPYWEKVDERDWAEFFETCDCSPSDPGLLSFMVRPVPPDKAPQIRVRLFRSEGDVLCIRSNHMTMDGGGAMLYLGLLSSVYRRLGSDPQYRPEARPPFRPGPRHVLGQTGLLPAVKALMKVRPPGAEWGMPRTGDDLSRQCFAIRRIGPERLEAIKRYARERGATVNDVLLAAYCRSLFEVLDPPTGKRFRVEVPVNLRRYLPDGSAGVVGDLSAVYFLNIERRPGEGFDDTLRRARLAIEAKKRNRTELGEMLLLELVLLPGMPVIRGLQRMVNFKIAHPALSNLGVVDPEVVNFGDVEVDDLQLIGPTLYPPNIGLGVSTFRRRMTLNMNVCSAAVDGGTVDRLLDLVLEELPGKSEGGELTDRDPGEKWSYVR
jgi:NRPS condensation-like uncharacterized protein